MPSPGPDVYLDEEERAALHADVKLVAAEARAVRRALSEVANFSIRRRRRDIVAFIFAIIVAIHAHEIGRDVCGTHQHGLTEGLPAQTIAACDVFWPESATDPAVVWPSPWNLVGFALYAVVMVGLLIWWRRTPNLLLPPEPTKQQRLDELEE